MRRYQRKMQQADLIWDDEARGLCVRVYPDGAKSFIFLYHFNGRQRFIRIGCSPGLSLKAARNRARELRRIVDEGCDPVANERDHRWTTSFEKFLRHVAEHMPMYKRILVAIDETVTTNSHFNELSVISGRSTLFWSCQPRRVQGDLEGAVLHSGPAAGAGGGSNPAAVPTMDATR